MSESQSSTLNPPPSYPGQTPVVPPIRVPLSASHYHTWKAHVTALLNGLELSKYVDSSIPPPQNTDTPEYKTWFKQDQLLLAAFIASAEPDAMPTISSSTTAAQAWGALNDLFDPAEVRISPEDVLKLFESHPKKWENLEDAQSTASARGYPVSRSKMHRVPHRLRMNKKSEISVYDPVMVSLGPYHHGRPELSQAEDFKHRCLHWCTDEGDMKKKTRLYYRVLNRIMEIKDSYADISLLQKFSDNELAMMMLLDSCFIFNFIENRTGKKQNNWPNCLGMAAAIPLAARDIMVLENQIPFFVVKMLIDANYNKEKGRELLQEFLSWMLSLEKAVIPRQDADPPMHILEACWRVIAETEISSQDGGTQEDGIRESNAPSTGNDRKPRYHTCPSVTDMKLKGIYVKPSSSHSIKDIRFDGSGYISSTLELPVRTLSDQTQVILSNMIAYEISPDAKTSLTVLSYTNFMKSLIQTPDDVKEFLEKGIFKFNRLANLEQVVKLFNSIDTLGLEDEMIYKDVIQRVGEHCNNKWKTWIAELGHGKFKSPWTITGLLTALLLVVLTFLQTYYAMNPPRPHAVMAAVPSKG